MRTRPPSGCCPHPAALPGPAIPGRCLAPRRRRTSDRLFLNFALAFALLAVNQLLVFALGVGDERGNYAYILRVLGFVLILIAIVDKNIFSRKREE